jgi:hypothetical protein
MTTSNMYHGEVTPNCLGLVEKCIGLEVQCLGLSLGFAFAVLCPSLVIAI